MSAGTSQFPTPHVASPAECLGFLTWPLSSKRVTQMLQSPLRPRPRSHRASLLPHSTSQSQPQARPASGVGRSGCHLFMGKAVLHKGASGGGRWRASFRNTSPYCVPGIDLSSGNTKGNKRDQYPSPPGAFTPGRGNDKKHVKYTARW